MVAPRRWRILVVGFAVALLFGVAVHFRLWNIYSQDNANLEDDDREALRRQFERANLVAMDESAEWRMKYDGEVEKNRRLEEELFKANASLQKQIESLKQQTEAYEQQCNCNQASSKP